MLLSKKKSNNWAIFLKFCNTGKLNEKHWILFHNIDSKSNVLFCKKKKKRKYVYHNNDISISYFLKKE